MVQAQRKQSGVQMPLKFDPWILGASLCLASLGLVMVLSASLAIAEKEGLNPFYFAIKHAIALGLGSLIGLVCLKVRAHNLEIVSPILLLLCVPLLLAVFVPGLGVTVNGATRWVRTGILNFQVAEAVKLLFVIYLAGYMVRRNESLSTSFAGVLKPMVMSGILAALLLLQPDFGSAVLLLCVTSIMVWLGGARIRDLLSLVIMAVPVVVWLAFSEAYRLKRLKSFLDPWADPFDGGFQLTQALIAIGRGEIFGVGLGGSVQKLFYLPEAHNDFILAVLSEELGLMGICVVLCLYAVLVGRGLVLGLHAQENGKHFVGYLCYGLSTLIGLQATISIGVNFGVLPTKGLTLPLISSGGSSVLMTGAVIGLLLRMAHEINMPSNESAPRGKASLEAVA